MNNVKGTKNHLPQNIALKKLLLSKIQSHICTMNCVNYNCHHTNDAMKRSPKHQN